MSVKSVAFVVITSVALTSAAWARGPVAIESYGGARPRDAGGFMAPVLAELEARGYASGKLGARIEDEVSLPGESLAPAAIADAERLIDHGYRAFLKGEFETATDELGRALDVLRSRPATIARNQQLRDPTIKAHLGLSLAHLRLGHAEAATQTMAEFVRSFPDREISRASYGPEPAELAKKVRAELTQRGRATLSISVDDPTAVIFINERFLAVGQASATDLFAGRYRIYVQRGTTPGRVHLVDVVPGSEHKLAVRWQLDAALSTRPFVGLVFDSEAARAASDAQLASDLGVGLDASQVVVLTITSIDRRRVIMGRVLDPGTGKASRSGALALEPAPPGRDKLVGLARYLAGGKPPIGVDTDPGETRPDGEGDTAEEPVPTPAPAALDRGGRRPYRLWKWLALGGGVAAAGAGVALIVLDGRKSCSTTGCSDEYDTALPGYVSAGVGAALIGVGIVLFVKDTSSGGTGERRQVGLAPVDRGLALTYGGNF
ncbi:MAG: hypothetical protein IT370_00525 [Deltaproteobacteria bacterium]|nr:hypothetical protein [Deltaproteobacteria bacterium]